ncbi:MAG: hypothetical protein K6E20_02220 [Acholeplasmatales bacterium]|nr:hypothetical protein [Acholeplasmatales bacterium]
MATFETFENAKDLIFQTHYYKASYEQIKKVYLEYIDKLGHTVVSINDDYCEIYSEVPRFTVVAKIIQQDPLETSIDFSIIIESLMGGGRKKAEQFIDGALKLIEGSYEFKGVALHK